jgi:8-oxo-dGTP pyrophosphatase MutT (NUDIX family)
MLNIYINNTPLTLATTKEAKQFTHSDTCMVARYVGKPKYLHHYIDLLEKPNKMERVVVFSNNFEQLKSNFESLFKIKEAAGGVVRNAQQEILMMYRRGSWDMAKGHIEEGETREIAAIREVQEETGLQNIELGSFLTTTYHTFRNKKNKRILKISYWFNMTTTDQQLVPQTEEDIEKLEWMPLEQAKLQIPIYQNILLLLGLLE